MTVEDELKQKALVAPLGEVYSAQNLVQTKLTELLEAYKAACDRMQADLAQRCALFPVVRGDFPDEREAGATEPQLIRWLTGFKL